jgi:Tfp pilus assembly protein PilO
MVIIVVALVVVLGAAWMLAVSPERKQASKLSGQVAAAKAALSSAEGQVASARTAQSQYAAAYASVVSLGKAVPPSQEVPSLIYELTQASDQKDVDFSSIATTTSTSAASTPTSAPAASTAATGFTQLPFTFVFEGSFFDLEHLFRQLTDFTTQSPSGTLQVSGRLLTIQSVKLAPVTTDTVQDKSAASDLTGTITASAYVLPASQGLTAATATSPTGATTPASTTGAASSPTAPAIVKVTP